MTLCKRGQFLSATAVGTASFAIGRAPARAAQFEYKSADQLPVDHPIHSRMKELWDAVERETNGRLVVKVFPAFQLGGQESLFSQLRLNAIQFMVTVNSTYSDFIPAAGIDSVGFAFKDPRAPWAPMTGALGEYVRKEFEAKGLYIPRAGIWDEGIRQVTTSTKPIQTAADFEGLKIRVPPAKIAVDLFRTLGASPVAISGEIYTAMQTHVIDAQETPFLQIYTQKFYEVQKYLSVTNHMWTGAWYVTNGDAWKALPPDIQAIVERNVAKYTQLERNDSYQQNSTLAARLRQVGLTLNTADTTTMRSRLAPYYARWKGEIGNTAWSLLEASVGKLA